MKNKNKKVLDNFVKYCKENPNEHKPKEDYEEKTLSDTFYGEDIES